jgi:hypothetical protein
MRLVKLPELARVAAKVRQRTEKLSKVGYSSSRSHDQLEGSRASSREPLFFCAIYEQPEQQLEADFSQNGRKYDGRS